MLPEITPLERWEISQPGNVLRVFERGGGPKGEVGEPVARRRCGQARRQTQHARIRNAASHRSGISRPAENAPARSAAFAAGHKRSARRLSRQRMHGMSRRSTQTIASAGALRAIRAVREPRLQRFERSDDSARRVRASRSATNSRARSRRASAWSATSIRARTWSPPISATPGGTTNPTATRCIRSSSDNPSEEEKFQISRRNPEGAAVRGLWSDAKFLAETGSAEFNQKLKTTQFADFHSHGWLFRAVYARDRQGHLLDEKGSYSSAGRSEEIRQGRAPRGHSPAKRNAVRGLPFRAGQPRRRKTLRRAARGHRTRLRRLPRHDFAARDADDFGPRGARRRHAPRSVAHAVAGTPL